MLIHVHMYHGVQRFPKTLVMETCWEAEFKVCNLKNRRDIFLQSFEIERAAEISLESCAKSERTPSWQVVALTCVQFYCIGIHPLAALHNGSALRKSRDRSQNPCKDV
jgi:hypothetical protein